MRERSVTVTFDLDKLQSYTDEYLAQIWHVCQADPADFGDREACETAEMVKAEIVRRWMARVPVELWNHQGRHVADKERMERTADERERLEFATALVDRTGWESSAEVAKQAWCGRSDAVDREKAIAKVVDALAAGFHVVVTRSGGSSYHVWTRWTELGEMADVC